MRSRAFCESGAGIFRQKNELVGASFCTASLLDEQKRATPSGGTKPKPFCFNQFALGAHSAPKPIINKEHKKNFGPVNCLNCRNSRVQSFYK